jgi:arylsulfatase A-like enzyme
MHYPHAVHRSDYWTSYRDGPWKVIYHYQPETEPPQPRYELFQLEDDPFEQRDLAAERPDELQRMMQGLVAALDACDAQFPLSKTDRRPLKPVIP